MDIGDARITINRNEEDVVDEAARIETSENTRALPTSPNVSLRTSAVERSKSRSSFKRRSSIRVNREGSESISDTETQNNVINIKRKKTTKLELKAWGTPSPDVSFEEEELSIMNETELFGVDGGGIMKDKYLFRKEIGTTSKDKVEFSVSNDSAHTLQGNDSFCLLPKPSPSKFNNSKEIQFENSKELKKQFPISENISPDLLNKPNNAHIPTATSTPIYASSKEDSLDLRITEIIKSKNVSPENSADLKLSHVNNLILGKSELFGKFASVNREMETQTDTSELNLKLQESASKTLAKTSLNKIYDGEYTNLLNNSLQSTPSINMSKNNLNPNAGKDVSNKFSFDEDKFSKYMKESSYSLQMNTDMAHLLRIETNKIVSHHFTDFFADMKQKRLDTVDACFNFMQQDINNVSDNIKLIVQDAVEFEELLREKAIKMCHRRELMYSGIASLQTNMEKLRNEYRNLENMQHLLSIQKVKNLEHEIDLASTKILSESYIKVNDMTKKILELQKPT